MNSATADQETLPAKAELDAPSAVRSGALLDDESKTMKKQIQITMPDGSIWGVPAEIVAENRSEYIADSDASSAADDFDEIKQREYEHTLKDNAELLDWAANNMNWNDVAHAAILIQPANVDFQEGWVNGKKRVAESSNIRS